MAEAHGTSRRHPRPASALWGWRWELCSGLAALVCFHVGVVVLGGPSGGVFLVGLPVCLVLSVPAWRRRAALLLRARSVDRWFSRALRLCGVVGPWGGRPVVRTSARVPAGTRLVVQVPAGHHVGHLVQAAPTLAASLRAREVRVVAESSDASVAHVTVVRRDPFGSSALPWPLLGAARVSLWHPVPIGVDEEGRVVPVLLPEHNLLLGGEPGAGKSATLSLLVAAAALDPSVKVTCFDAKQVELACWADVSERFVGPDLDEAAAALDDLREEMDARYERLLARRRRKVEPSDGLSLHLVVVDELAFYLRSGERAKRQKVTEGLRDLVSRGRAAGIIVVAATQKPGHETVPTWVRDLFGYRMALRCTTKDASDTVLGQGWASLGYSAASIDPSCRGVGFLLAEGGVPVKLRTYYLSDGDLARVAMRAGQLRGLR